MIYIPISLLFISLMIGALMIYVLEGNNTEKQPAYVLYDQPEDGFDHTQNLDHD